MSLQLNGSLSTQHDTYNYCNMPHVGSTGFENYPTPPPTYELQYVEIVQRHHKRTPYASNTFPVEDIEWHCDDTQIVSYGIPEGRDVTAIHWLNYQEDLNPFSHRGFNGTCQLPQITKDGLHDSFQHGANLRSVYVDGLKFIPSELPNEQLPVEIRVTSNTITSQVAGALLRGLYPSSSTINVFQQIDSSDSLRPGYPCPAADTLRSSYQKTTHWTDHLTNGESVALFKRLDEISGVNPSDSGWHVSFDHYFDNLSSKACHGKPLPCSITKPESCVTPSEADKVYAMGQLDYALLYKLSPIALKYSTLKYGVFLWELVAHLRAARSGNSVVKYRHGIGHDGSISPLLGALQVETMVWPGMGSEVVFELWRSKANLGEEHFVRVLWGGQPMRTSSPLGTLDMVPFSKFEDYILSLVGEGANLVVEGCKI